MRIIAVPVKTYSETLLANGTITEPTQIIPNLGPLQGFYVVLTVTLAGATASQSSNTIDRVLGVVQGQDQFGGIDLDIVGTDISVLNDILQPRGVRTSPPVITTSAGGAGSATWSFFLPLTVGAKDMPAKLNIVWQAASVLQNGALVSAGTATVTLNLRAAYSSATDQPTLRIKANNPPHASGDNAIQQYLPNGEQVEALAFTLAGDANLNYVTLTVANAFFLNQSPAQDFQQQDAMLMQSGHLSGEFITRIPTFIVDSVTTMDINLATDSVIRLYTISTVPQKRSS